MTQAVLFETERREMVEQQLRRRGIRDERVLDAMLSVPRHEFVPPGFLGMAYDDRPVPIGASETISQPYIVAAMTEAELGDVRGESPLERDDDGTIRRQTGVDRRERLARQVFDGAERVREVRHVEKSAERGGVRIVVGDLRNRSEDIGRRDVRQTVHTRSI